MTAPEDKVEVSLEATETVATSYNSDVGAILTALGISEHRSISRMTLDCRAAKIFEVTVTRHVTQAQMEALRAEFLAHPPTKVPEQ